MNKRKDSLSTNLALVSLHEEMEHIGYVMPITFILFPMDVLHLNLFLLSLKAIMVKVFLLNIELQKKSL